MRFFICIFFFFVSYLSCEDPSLQHALYLIKQRPVKAIQIYRETYRKTGRHHYEILRHMSMMLLEEGMKQSDIESKTLATYGAGLAASTLAFPILEKSFASEHPNLQLMSLFFLSKLQEDQSTTLLEKAASRSLFLSTRAEACYHLALRKEPKAASYASALMSSLPKIFRPLFPQLFAICGTKEANAVLHQLLQDQSPLVRLQAILSLVQNRRDDFLPMIRMKASQRDIAETEACAYAFGIFKDAHSLSTLLEFATSSPINIRIAALKSLYLLGDESKIKDLEILALSHNLFAIQALAEIPGSEDTLHELLNAKNTQVRINAIAALLARKDPRVSPHLIQLLLEDERELGLRMQSSVGGSQKALNVFSLSCEDTEEGKRERALSFIIKETLLRSAMHLPENPFLSLAKNLLESRQSAFVPCLMQLLKNLRTEPVINLLKKQAESIGSPLVRDYANLTLFSLNEQGPYEARVYARLDAITQEDVIQIRDHLPLIERQDFDNYTLSAKEKSQLLLDIFSEILARQEREGIDKVLSVMEKTNAKTRLALAGFLIRASQ